MKMFSKKRTGYTKETPKRLLLDAGVFFKNFSVGTDTFETATAAGKNLGATRGGGEFKATPTIRRLEIDDLPENAKDNAVIDRWDVSLTANLLEVSEKNLALALAASTQADGEVEGYYTIKGKAFIEEGDFIENITFVGRLSGAAEPVIIQVFNTFNTNGLTLATASNGESVMQVIFTGNYDIDDVDRVPFDIYYPKLAAEPNSGES